MSVPTHEIATEMRRFWMGLLAKSPVAEVENAWDGLENKPEFCFLRQPETGLIMVRAKAGGEGARFNLGEMLVTRCTVRIGSGQVGCAFIMGRSHRHAELAAIFDALLQNRNRHDEIRARVIDPLERIYQENLKKKSEKVAATKVDFYTLVRGE